MSGAGPTPPPALGAVAGRWRTEGTVVGDPPVAVTGTDSYELLEGGHFLLHRVDVRVGSRPVRAVEIIGERDPDSGDLLARSYDDTGTVALMRLRIDDDAWRFRGGADVAPAARTGGEPPEVGAVRSTLRIAADRRTMTALWERADDGVTWQPWMDMRFTLVEP